MSDIDDELFALAGGDEDADVEEGEASSVAASSPNSLGSDAMEESDSEADNDDDVPARSSDIPYPLEGKYIDAKDKARINGLPQLERERILGERAEELNKAQWAAELSRRAKEKELQGTPTDRKRKASSIEPDDSQRKSSRQKVRGKNEKLEAYKLERAQRGQQRQRHDDRRNRRRSSSYDSRRGSDRDADGESEVEYTEYDNAPRQEEPAELRHFESIRVGRGFFAEVCFNPGFEEAMAGAFVRVGTGQDSHHRTLYKMAQIKEFVKGKPYVLEGNKPGQRIATDQYVVVYHGAARKEYNFSFLSNQRFTEADLDAYKQSLAETNAKLPTQTMLKEKYDAIRDLMNHSWTDAEVTQRLAKSHQYAHLLKQRSADQPRIATQAELEAQRIAELNSRNRRLDSERVRKALIEEQRQKKLERRREIERKKKEEEEAARKKAEEEKAAEDDLFGGDSKTEDQRDTPKPAEKEQAKGLPTFRKPKLDDDIIASLDIGVEIEI